MRSCSSAVISSGIAPNFETIAVTTFTAFESTSLLTTSVYGDPLKSSALANPIPVFSLPAIGCPPTNETFVAKLSRAARQISRLVLPASVTSVPGFNNLARDRRKLIIDPTGAARYTRPASLVRPSSNESSGPSITPSAIARSSTSRVSHPAIRSAMPARRTASANDPPINPTPTIVSCLKYMCRHNVQLDIVLIQQNSNPISQGLSLFQTQSRGPRSRVTQTFSAPPFQPLAELSRDPPPWQSIAVAPSISRTDRGAMIERRRTMHSPDRDEPRLAARQLPRQPPLAPPAEPYRDARLRGSDRLPPEDETVSRIPESPPYRKCLSGKVRTCEFRART